MTDRLLRRALIVVSAVGIGVAGYLTYVHYQPEALICTTGGGCETVQHSKYAVLAGIPIAIFGLAAWVTALVLTLWNSELARTLTAALAIIVLAFAAYLVILQLFVIDAVCVWCMTNDVVLAPLFAVLALVALADGRDPGGSRLKPVTRAGSGHRDLPQDIRLDPVEDLGQRVARSRDAVVAEADHGVRGVRLAVDQVGNRLGQLLRPTRVVDVGGGDTLHPRVHVEDCADVRMCLVDHPVLDRVDRDAARLDPRGRR